MGSDRESVLGDQGRAFKRVFDGAQQTLRTVFGMQMVELPLRDRLTKEEKRKGKHAIDCPPAYKTCNADLFYL